MRIPGAHGMELRDIAKRTVRQFQDDEVLTVSAAVAFHAILAIFPFLLCLLALFAFLNVPGFFDWLLDQASRVLPGPATGRIQTVVREIERQHRGGLLSLALAGALWAASGGVRALMGALNRAYDVKDPRPFWRRYLLSLAYTVGLAGLVLAAAALMLVGPRVVAWVAAQLGIGTLVVTLWAWLRLPVAIAMLLLLCGLVYSLFPRVDGFRLLTPGSVLAVPLWLGASALFRLYTGNFADYNAIYGSLGAAMLLLLYFWITSIILLLGAELNGVLRRGRNRDAGDDGCGRNERLAVPGRRP